MIPVDTSFPVEEMFDAFVERFGGLLVRKLISNVNPAKNADYIFDNPQLVVELKCIEREGFPPEAREKLNKLGERWNRLGLIRTYGTVKLELRELPPQCQQEWMQVLQTPWKRKLADANRQI
jgi:hypothetical protein